MLGMFLYGDADNGAAEGTIFYYAISSTRGELNIPQIFFFFFWLIGRKTQYKLSGFQKSGDLSSQYHWKGCLGMMRQTRLPSYAPECSSPSSSSTEKIQ